MQIFYNIVVLVLSCWCLWCSICFVAQSQSTAGRHPCVDSCNRTDIDVCATNGQNCKRFPSNCELQRDNCNLTLATGWNRTNSIECSYLQLNGTGLCACSPHGLRECSNRTVTPGICVHGGTGHRRQQCHLFGTECDLRRARCVGTEWHEIDNRQCRGFAVNQTNPCHCPKLVQCSSVSRLSCVQVNQSTCRLYGNECELERGRCDGQRSSDVDILHCYKFQANQSQSCYCPALLNCQRNDTTNICVRNAAGRCQLLANNCDLERRKCIGEDLRPIHTIQCSNMTVNQQSSCFCPKLNTCSTSRRSICVRTRRGCKLFVSECQAEEARCRGEVLETLDPVQCHGFRDEEEKSCSCPKMSTCSTNQTSICVRSSSSDCTLLRNECELERYKCQNPTPPAVSLLHCREFEFGQNRTCSCPNLFTCSRNTTNICIRDNTGCRHLRSECDLEELKCQGIDPTILPAEQCRHIKPGERGSCNCPKWLTCSNSTTRLCVETNNGCELIQNECDLERRRCQGEVLNNVNIELCPNFRFGQVRPCFCPALKSCGQNSTSKINICVKGTNGCKLMHDNCELELAKCLGERWSIQDPIQCLGIALGNVGQCFCPEMEHCSHWGNSSICVRKHKQCKRLTNRCDLEKSICLEEGFSVTTPLRCLSMNRGSQGECECPALDRCNNSQRICGQIGSRCKLFRNDCDHKAAGCRGENWRRTSMHNCCQFRVNQISKCSLSNDRGVCGRTSNNRCRIFSNRCQLNAINTHLQRKYSVVAYSRCKCLNSGRVGRCTLKPSCNVPRGNRRDVCGRSGDIFRWFNSRCQLQHTNFNSCEDFRPVRKELCGGPKT